MELSQLDHHRIVSQVETIFHKVQRMKTIAIVQARTGSSRLPGKILLPLKGKSLLERMLERVTAATTLSEVMVATTRKPEDEPIREICRRLGIQCYSGHPTDLLDRHYKAAVNFKADIVVKIPSDCPLIDPTVIDRVLRYYFDNLQSFDFVSNLHPATYPDGNDVEAMPVDILGSAWIEASRDYEREHTTPFIWEQPDRFRLGNFKWERGLDYSMTHRWTIDYPEDYTFIQSIFDELYSQGKVFSMSDILKLLTERPELQNINQKYAGVNWYRNHLRDLKTVNTAHTRMIK